MNERITPEDIGPFTLNPGQIFVFGSNEYGSHGAGAARLAFNSYGALPGQGFGLMGGSFGIPTKDWEVETLPISVVKFYIDRFIEFTYTRGARRLKFYVTRIGCGLAGFTPEEIAPLFTELIDNENVWLPQDFLDIINNKKPEDVSYNK